MTKGIDFKELLDYSEGENQRWHRWFAQYPETLAIEAGIADEQNVGGLVFHICAVELRHAQRLIGVDPSPYEQLRSASSPDKVFALATQAGQHISQFLEKSGAEELNAVISFDTQTAGRVTTSRRKLLVHILVHGIRHWAQIATALRKAGYRQDWQHDFLFSDAFE